jgi:hypothetical protein
MFSYLLFIGGSGNRMSSQAHHRAHSAPNVAGAAGLLLQKRRRHHSKCHAKSAGTADVIFGKTNQTK